MKVTAPQCPYCPTLMVFFRVHESHVSRRVEWLCPACKMSKLVSVRPTDGEQGTAQTHEATIHASSPCD